MSSFKELPPQITDPRDVTTLTQRLVQIPSYVNIIDSKTGTRVPEERRVDERAVASYVADYLQQYTNLTVRKQQVVDGRFNVIAANSETPKLVLLGHTDTVRPSNGSLYDQLAAEVHDGKIYGLGAADMKSGLASILSATALFKKLPDVMLAFYIDEEYDFAGMRALIKDSSIKGKPELLLSADGADMQLGNGCRGLIELHGTMLGKSAHAGRPHLGVNAINGVVDTFRDLQQSLGRFSHESLGDCSVNLASLDGGKAGRNDHGELVVFEQVNAVPDIAKFKVDIRTTSTEVSPNLVIDDIIKYCSSNALSVDDIRIHHALGAWYTDQSELQSLKKIVESVLKQPVQFSDLKAGGYIDMQMLWESMGRPTAATIGPSLKELAHKPDEYVVINDLLKSRDVFAEVINSYATKTRTSSKK